MARRALGRFERDRTRAELAEFAGLIHLRFLRWYTRLLEREGEPRIAEETTSGGWAVLSATISRADRFRPERHLLYRLHRADSDRWLVYDVEFNGVSRLRTFHREFDRIILNEGYRELVDRIHADLRLDRGARTDPGQGRDRGPRRCGGAQ
jgi:ABC-type transporter MlaC component